ncbi:MAG TPA: hypothetical protein VFD22_13720 [Gemmatimonadaceae bacterium]|nr:hypothetical protein [Gemmatimonadaceae bacterium]
MRKTVKLLLSLTAFSGTAGAQADMQRVASDAFNARDWARAADAYLVVAKTDTVLPLPHMRRAIALTALGRYVEAQKEIAIAESKGAPAMVAGYRLAAVYAGLGKVDDAFAQLKRATDGGLGQIPNPGDSLPPMAKLKADARYAKFLTDVDRNAHPCMYADHTKEFDFWVGSWDVRPKGAPTTPPARNEVTKIDDGCVVHESWTAPGSVGQSFNIYDSTRSKWFQIWVDNSGGLHEYSGNYSDNAMRYEGTTPALPPATGRVQTRLTFFKLAPDTVRQFSESLKPDGTWGVNYDLIYTRRKE